VTPTATNTNTPTETPTATNTPEATATSTATSTATPTPVAGDIDDDDLPDVAFVGSGSSADVVVNIGDTPTKITVPGPFLGTDIGIPPNGSASKLISVSKPAKSFVWSATDVLSGNTESFKTTIGTGTPVMGCYVDGTYTAASFTFSRVTSTMKLFTGSPDTVVRFPTGVLLARCGSPVDGKSAVFSLVQKRWRKTLNVVGKVGARQVLRTSNLSTRLSATGIILIPVPRASGVHPTVAVIARQGKSRVMQLSDRSNRWQTITVPNVPPGHIPTAAVGVRIGDSTYIVVQITSPAKETSYRTVVVPAGFL
jgi:hypothetical protein